MKYLTAKQKRQWVAALRSGKYRQTKGKLRGPRGYCCLGVLAEEMEFKSSSNTYLEGHGEYQFLPGRVQCELGVLNDNGVPFEVIAGLIEEAL